MDESTLQSIKNIRKKWLTPRVDNIIIKYNNFIYIVFSDNVVQVYTTDYIIVVNEHTIEFYNRYDKNRCSSPNHISEEYINMNIRDLHDNFEDCQLFAHIGADHQQIFELLD